MEAGGGTGGAADVGFQVFVAGAGVPHPGKQERGGEDAFFAESGCAAFGVADGVGGWSAHGIDPSLYPRWLLSAGLRAGAGNTCVAPAWTGDTVLEQV